LSAYGIEVDDRPLVRAFARGVERTQRLRFDYPGLGTVATRSGEALVVESNGQSRWLQWGFCAEMNAA
jgi:hypothetical protein